MGQLMIASRVRKSTQNEDFISFNPFVHFIMLSAIVSPKKSPF